MIPTWILVFMFNGQPMASGPHELPQCLIMAQAQNHRDPKHKAHCYKIYGFVRVYPDMNKDYGNEP